MSSSNSKITFKGEVLEIIGKALNVGQALPSVKLTANDMSDSGLEQYKGKVRIILSVPSLDTPVCSAETLKFNEEASKISDNLKVIVVSRDLPFAQKRWCGTEGISSVVTLSDYKYQGFGEAFGVLIQSWGLLARAVFVVDQNSVVRYVEYVPEVSSEPNYALALESAKKLL